MVVIVVLRLEVDIIARVITLKGISIYLLNIVSIEDVTTVDSP